MMEAETMSCFPLKSDQQGLELVNPSKRSLTDKAALVHNRVEVSFASSFHCLSIALILSNVGLDTSIPQQFPRCSRIEAAIRIEGSTFVLQPTAFHIFEDVRKF